MIFTYLGAESDKTISPNYKSQPYDTTKSFDNLHFNGKENLVDKIDYFINNEDKYRKLGIPYTFGLLLHGAPGTVLQELCSRNW
jgi:SpoVK/Ycf46/Vps4 family AAA+-type ATPase